MILGEYAAQIPSRSQAVCAEVRARAADPRHRALVCPLTPEAQVLIQAFLIHTGLGPHVDVMPDPPDKVPIERAARPVYERLVASVPAPHQWIELERERQIVIARLAQHCLSDARG